MESIFGLGIGKNPLIRYFGGSETPSVVLIALNSLTVVEYKLDRLFFWSTRFLSLFETTLLSNAVLKLVVENSSFVLAIAESNC